MGSLQNSAAQAGWIRPRHDRMVAGVCSGVARKLGMSAGLVRIAFLLSILLPGPQFLAYLAGWLLMPEERY